MRHVPAAAWLVAGLAALPAGALALCPDRSQESRYARVEAADVVVEGNIERIELDELDPCGRPYRAVVKVSRHWKGSNATSLTVVAHGGRSIRGTKPEQPPATFCGMVEAAMLEPEKSYIIYAQMVDGSLIAEGCGVTAEATAAERTYLDEWETTVRSRAPPKGGRTNGCR